jgi:hypothetical protein
VLCGHGGADSRSSWSEGPALTLSMKAVSTRAARPFGAIGDFILMSVRAGISSLVESQECRTAGADVRMPSPDRRRGRSSSAPTTWIGCPRSDSDAFSSAVTGWVDRYRSGDVAVASSKTASTDVKSCISNPAMSEANSSLLM